MRSEWEYRNGWYEYRPLFEVTEHQAKNDENLMLLYPIPQNLIFMNSEMDLKNYLSISFINLSHKPREEYLETLKRHASLKIEISSIGSSNT